jgi:hypothetical protein
MLDPTLAERWARMILGCVHREYPYHLVHAVASAEEVRPPRELTPAFYGCYDWHSAVHGHWSLVRLLRVFPNAAWAADVTRALSQSFTPENIAAEVAYQQAPHRKGFERPYGLAWLLQLAAELREVPDGPFLTWRQTLAPLEALAVKRLGDWLPKLPFPIRSGEHSQTAFALGLCFDWARTADDAAFEQLIRQTALAHHHLDQNASFDFEPSGQDFLSPVLGEADLMRRVLRSPEGPDWFSRWLSAFLPDLRGGDPDFLTPVRCPDPADGKLAHLDGLNLSRAWMLDGIASALSTEDPRREGLLQMSRAHAEAGLQSLTGEHYAGAHWLGTFAIYLTTRPGAAGEASR